MLGKAGLLRKARLLGKARMEKAGLRNARKLWRKVSLLGVGRLLGKVKVLRAARLCSRARGYPQVVRILMLVLLLVDKCL